MSWSIDFKGTTEEVVEKLENHAETISFGDAKKEYELVKPHLIGLVKWNFNKNDTRQGVQVTANGHADISSDEFIHSSLNCVVKSFYVGDETKALND